MITAQDIEIFKEVLKRDLISCSSSLNSAVYFITPVFIAPLAKVNIIVIKFVKAPINATPAGPVNIATALPAINPDEMRIIVIIAE